MAAFLDCAAGAPVHPAARAAWAAALEDGWADPAKLYSAGRRARLLLDAAREAMAEMIGARADEIEFAPSATYARHAAVRGTVLGQRGQHVVASAVEHSAILQAAGPDADLVEVDAQGRVEAAMFATRARGAAVAALQAANHEVGTLQPVDAVRALLDDVPLLVDAAQVLGHADLPTGWSVLVADPRTWGSVPGAGLLAIRTGVRWRSPYPADENRLPGGPDLPAIVAAVASLRAVEDRRVDEEPRRRRLIDQVRAEVARTVPDVDLVGDPDRRAPHIVTFSCLYADGESLLRELDRRGFAVSSGSSCTSSTLEPSHVLVAMGALTSGNLRISVGHDTTPADLEQFLAVLPDVVAGVRAEVAGW